MNLKDNVIITDAGSTKLDIVEAAEHYLAGDKFMNSAGDMIQDISKSTVQSLGSFVGGDGF